MKLVIAVGCHADDEVIGPGAALAAHAEAGAHVVVHLITTTYTSRYTSEMRYQISEAYRKVDAALGVHDRKVHDFKPTSQLGTTEIGCIAPVIMDEILKYKADDVVIYTHHPLCLHQDHRVAAMATLVAVRPFSDALLAHHFRSLEVLAYEIPNIEAAPLEWDTFVPLEKRHVKAQRQAMEAYTPEVPPRFEHPWHPEMLTLRAQEIGSRLGVPYAAHFKTLYRIGGHLIGGYL